MRKYPRGRRGSPAKGVAGLKPGEGSNPSFRATTSSRTSYRSRRRFFVPNKRHLSLTSSLLLSKLNPLALGFNLGFSFSRTAYRSRRLFAKVTSHSFRRSSFSKLNPLRWASIWDFSFSRTSYHSRRRFFVPNKRHRSFTSSLLLSKLNPLRWASIWVFFCKVRSTSFPA